jgi:hypothetical protein
VESIKKRKIPPIILIESLDNDFAVEAADDHPAGEIEEKPRVDFDMCLILRYI